MLERKALKQTRRGQPGYSHRLFFLIALLWITACTEPPSPRGNGPIIAANELAAISQLRAIASAEANYQATAGSGNYGTLQQLVDSQSINQLTGERRGYRFEVRITPSPSFEATATPLQYGFNGRNSFFMSSTDAEIHSADKKGAEATASDPVLN